MVPVHSEQCSPAIRARIRCCPAVALGSEAHSCGGSSTLRAVVAAVIG